MANVREEVMAYLTDIARNGLADGEDSLSAITSRHPDVPLEVAVIASLRADEEATEKWWSSVERTIDGEIIKNALTQA